MENNLLTTNNISTSELANVAISRILNGEVDPLVAIANISTVEKAIKKIKDDVNVKLIILSELSKYNKSKTSIGSLTIEECETAIKYDYSSCNDTVYNRLSIEQKELADNIKEREKVLKSLSKATMILDDDTGELMRVLPPIKTSTTSYKITESKK